VCGAMKGYPGNPKGATLSLYAIAYGSFTAAGADEAYLSYGSSVEPHANNFGGGVLLAREGGAWRVVHWYPGGQMDNCLALPAAGKTRMLCLSGWTGQGELDSSLWVKEAPFAQDRAVLKAQDQRGVAADHGIAPDICGEDQPAPLLLSIDALKRAEDSSAFAVASIRYATAKDVREACTRTGFARLRVTKGEVKIVVDKGRVKAIAPLRFAPTDY
ncbi:MAG TPA: hypothetical protein VL993_08975, partial [Stellaceae bacterium]|nr:hypothetical protein [Stellaceae bacterium]